MPHSIYRNETPFWLLVLAAGATVGVCFGIRQAFGLYLAPISADLGLGRNAFALSMGLMNLTWGLAAFPVGAIADRYGATRVIVTAALCYMLGIYLMATARSESQLVIAGAVLGFGVAGGSFTAVLGAVGRAAAPSRRQMGITLTGVGGSIGMFAAMPYAHWLIASVGRQESLMVLAATAGLMAIFALAFVSAPTAGSMPGAQSMGAALREAMAHPGFVLLTLGFFVCGFHVAFVSVHLPAFLKDKAFDAWLGAGALAAIGLGNILGSLLCGKAGELIEKRLALSLLYFGRAILFLVFIYMPLSEVTVLVLSFALGILWLGTVPLTSGLIMTLFGPTWMSMLFGITFLAHQIGSFLGAWLGGFLYDVFKSYDAMWWISILLGIGAALINLPIRERPVARLSLDAVGSGQT